jgi:hypothetical protein
MLAHSSCRIALNYCGNSGFFERASDQLRFWAAAARLYDNKLGVLHGSIIAAVGLERSIRHAAGSRFTERT